MLWRRLEALAARGSIRAATFTLFTLAVTWPLLTTAASMNLFRDAQVLYAYERDAAWSVLHFGALPLWDPYYCGGLYALGTPQSRFASPTFLLSLMFGPARGEALTIFAMMVVGLEGTFRYLSVRGTGAWPALLASPVFAMSGVFIASPFLGWTNFFGFELIPGRCCSSVAGFRRETSAAVSAALVVAWIIGFGGTYAAPMVLLLGVYELAEWLFNPRRTWPERRRAIEIAGFVLAFAVAVSAVRLVPLLETLHLAPRVIAGKPSLGLLDALGMLVQPVLVEDGNLVAKRMYLVGVGALALAVVGLFRRRTWPLVPLGLAALCTALGYGLGPWGPFGFLKHLPVYSALRYPERYLIVVALVVAVAAGNGLRLLQIRGAPPAVRRRGFRRRQRGAAGERQLSVERFSRRRGSAIAGPGPGRDLPAISAGAGEQVVGGVLCAHEPRVALLLGCVPRTDVAAPARGPAERRVPPRSSGGLRDQDSMDAQFARARSRLDPADRVAGQSEFPHWLAQQRGAGPGSPTACWRWHYRQG